MKTFSAYLFESDDDAESHRRQSEEHRAKARDHEAAVNNLRPHIHSFDRSTARSALQASIKHQALARQHHAEADRHDAEARRLSK